MSVNSGFETLSDLDVIIDGKSESLPLFAFLKASLVMVNRAVAGFPISVFSDLMLGILTINIFLESHIERKTLKPAAATAFQDPCGSAQLAGSALPESCEFHAMQMCVP